MSETTVVYVNESGGTGDKGDPPTPEEILAVAEPVVQAAVPPAVDAVVATRDFVFGSDPRLPVLQPGQDAYVAVVTDAGGVVTWLAARSEDGGPADVSLRLLRDRTGVGGFQPADEYLFAVVDAEGRVSDLAVRASDGGFADATVDRLRERLGVIPRPGETVRYADVPYDPAGAVLPMVVRDDALVGWGSSTMQHLSTELSQMASDAGMTWFSGGKASERVEHNAARSNAIPARLAFPGGVIPAEGAVAVTSSNLTVMEHMRPYRGVVTVDGAQVVGVVSSTAESIVFTRESVGESVPVPGEVTVTAIDGVEHRNDTMLLQVGKNNLTSANPTLNDPALVAEKTLTMWGYQAGFAKRGLVIGQFVNTGTGSANPIRERIYTADGLLRDALGVMYLDTHAWVTGDEVWDDVAAVDPDFPGPTSDDLAQQAIGNKPGSISSDPGHFDAVGLAAYRRKIQRHLTGLGWVTI